MKKSGTRVPETTVFLGNTDVEPLEAVRRSVAAVMMRPDCLAALEAGLCQPDAREARLWWRALAELIDMRGDAEETTRAVSITFVKHAPPPVHEDGCLETGNATAPGQPRR